MSKISTSSHLILSIIILSMLTVSSGCTRGGGFSKAGAYEMLKDINRNQNTEVLDRERDDVEYQEYERERQQLLKKKRNS